MNREDYQNAFSKLEPSPELIETALSGRRKHRSGARLGTVLLAAVLVTAVLAGTVFAAVHFHWFSIGDAEHIVRPTHDTEAAHKDESGQPDPQNLLTLEGPSSATRIGFTLPESYLDGQDTLNCWMLSDGLYRRYYRNPDPDDPESPLLTAEIVYDADYLTRYASELVREGELAGLQTVWLKVEGSADGRPQYVLFQRNEALGCFGMIVSTESFEAAEQLAADMEYRDSGIELAQREDPVYYGFRLGWEPENWTPDSKTVMADRWYLVNAKLRDENLDLQEILLSQNFVFVGETSCTIGISLVEGLTDIAPIEYGTVYKTETVDGRVVRWVNGYGGDSFVQILFREQQVQLIACISCYGPNVETGDMEELPAEEAFVEIAERLLESAELIPVAIAEPAPQDFYPFSVG